MKECKDTLEQLIRRVGAGNLPRPIRMKSLHFRQGSPEKPLVYKGLADCWIRTRLQQAAKSVTEAVEQYRFDWLAHALYEVIWNDNTGYKF